MHSPFIGQLVAIKILEMRAQRGEVHTFVPSLEDRPGCDLCRKDEDDPVHVTEAQEVSGDD